MAKKSKKVNKKFKKKKKKTKKRMATKSRTYIRVPFGAERVPFGAEGIAPGDPSTKRLEFGYTKDGASVWLKSRLGTKIHLRRDEAVELIGLLLKLYPLDAMGQI